ncbi:MAG: hypothetical protein M3R72_09965 [Bacteroidota bacterium]|nr:hypothetical protein [Bacteroidota bacterium]
MIFVALIAAMFSSCSQKQDFVDDMRKAKMTKFKSLILAPDGTTDNTSMLQSLIDNKNTNPLNATGVYLTSQLTVHSYDTIIMQSGLTMLLNPSVTKQAVLYLPSGTHDVYIQSGTIDANQANNSNGSQLECIKMDDGCYNITINGVTVNNAKDYGAIQVKGYTGSLCRNIQLLNIVSNSTGRTAIECRGVDNIVISKPNLQHWGQQNAASAAIQFQSVASHNVQILSPVTNGYEGNQFAIESAAANVDSVYIANGNFIDKTNNGNNGISGYFTNANFYHCNMTGGVGSQRSGYELFGSNLTVDHPVVKRGIIAISTGSVTNKNASNINILYPNVASGASNNSALALGSWNGLVLSNVTITGGTLDTRAATGNSSAFTFGFYGATGIVQNVIMNKTKLYSSTSAVRIQAANGSKNLVFNQVGFMQQTQLVSNITNNVSYVVNP